MKRQMPCLLTAIAALVVGVLLGRWSIRPNALQPTSLRLTPLQPNTVPSDTLRSNALQPNAVRAGALVIRREANGWIGVWRGDVLESEWHRDKDPELWQWLDKLLREDGSLYDRPQPSVRPRQPEPPLPRWMDVV
jgi:hypothetical protein